MRALWSDTQNCSHNVSKKLTYQRLSELKLHRYPKDPPVSKILRRANSLQRLDFATAIAERYGEVSELSAWFSRENRQQIATDRGKTMAVAKYYGFKLCSIFSTEGSFGYSNRTDFKSLAGWL